MKKFITLLIVVVLYSTTCFASPSDTTLMRVGPNPTKQILNLYPGTNEIFCAQLCDAKGKPIGSGNHSRVSSLSMNGLRSGVYFLKITFAQKPPVVFKIIKTT